MTPPTDGLRSRFDALEARTTAGDRGPHGGRGLPVAADEVLDLFDALPAVSTTQMLGTWRGSGLPSGHPWDGMLEAFGWRGKRYDSVEDAHPLVFEDARGTFSANPAHMPLGLVQRYPALARSTLVRRLGRPSLRLFRTSRPAARLRTVEYRGVATGTMVYDALAINDHFRQVDPDTLLGAMDMRGFDAPFFFVLRRETGVGTA